MKRKGSAILIAAGAVLATAVFGAGAGLGYYLFSGGGSAKTEMATEKTSAHAAAEVVSAEETAGNSADGSETGAGDGSAAGAVTETSAASEAADGAEETKATEAASATEVTEAAETVSGSEDAVEQMIAQMSLEDKVAQMFIVLPEQLVGGGQVTAAGEQTQAAFDQIPVGGMIYMEPNLESAGQISQMLSSMQVISMNRTGLPAFLCVDEEGGTVSRINGRGIVDSAYIGDMADIGASGVTEDAYLVGDEMGTYLSALGFNVDFAPCADVLTNPENTVVSRRSFGADPFTVTAMTGAVMKGLHAHGIMTAYKHFPGHGATSGDTHAGMAYTNKTLEEMESAELLPFKSAVNGGSEMIMVGHISAPNVTGDDTPASLSKILITDVLRTEMGYDGIVITDAMNMGAIAQNYSSATSAVMSVKAGTDIILMPSDLSSAYNGVLQAVYNGEISEERINESLRRIIKAKQNIRNNQ